MHATKSLTELGCHVRQLEMFNGTSNRYAVTLWAHGHRYVASWVSPTPPSLDALLENLRAFPFAWRPVGQPPAGEFLS